MTAIVSVFSLKRTVTYNADVFFCADSQQAGSQAGKVKRGTGATPYHPYSR